MRTEFYKMSFKTNTIYQKSKNTCTDVKMIQTQNKQIILRDKKNIQNGIRKFLSFESYS